MVLSIKKLYYLCVYMSSKNTKQTKKETNINKQSQGKTKTNRIRSKNPTSKKEFRTYTAIKIKPIVKIQLQQCKYMQNEW